MILKQVENGLLTLFIVDEIKPGRGICLTDAFSPERKIFLTDIGLSYTAKKGLLIAIRVISIDNLNFTSGGGCMFEGKHLRELKINFIHLFEKKKREMSWTEMMRRYNYYFFKKMKEFGVPMSFQDIE